VSITFTGLYLVCAELMRALAGRSVDAELARQAREREAAAADAEADAIAERIAAVAQTAESTARQAQRGEDAR
jgi:hypothetical protein